MAEFKGTKGKWSTEECFDYEYNQPIININSDGIEAVCTVWSGGDIISNNTKADALLISKAPEMLEMIIKARLEISRLKGTLMAHPDHTEGSEFDDRTSSAQEIEDSINQLIKEATEV